MQQIAQGLSQGLFSDPVTMTHLDLVFANLYFAAADAREPSAAPAAWQPLLNRRAEAGTHADPVPRAHAGTVTAGASRPLLAQTRPGGPNT